MGWSITPSDLASIDSNGHVTFSRHTERDITYTITYSDANFTCSKSCTVYKCPDPCTCANANFNVSVAPDGIDIPASGYTSLRTIGNYNSATCLTGITATSSENWITDITVGGGNIRAKATENASLTQSRQSTITVTGKDGSGSDCSDAFIVTQVPSASTCNCASITFQADATAAGSSIPAEGYSTSTVIGEYTHPTCLTGVTATSNVNWVTITNVSNGNVSATVQANSSTENGRTGTITVSGVDAYGETCSDPFDVSQQPSAITCTCDSLTVSPRLNCIPETGGTGVNLGSYSDGGCITNIGASSKPDWINSINFSNGIITGNVDETNKYTERAGIIVVTGMAATQTCSKDLPVCQDSKICDDSIEEITINLEVSCEMIEEITHVDFPEVKGKHLENGECVTYTVAIGNKTLYIHLANNDRGDSGGTAIAKNTTNSDIHHPAMDIFYNYGTNRYYTYSPTPSGIASIKIGTVNIIQDKCKCDDCAPGTDNYIVMKPEGGEYPYAQLHPLNFASDSGAKTGDSQDCGYVYADCGLQMTFKEGWMGDYEQRSTDASKYDFVRMNLDNTPQGIVTGFPGGTAVSSNLGFITTSANNSWLKRYAVYTVTPYNKTASCPETSTCTGCTGENLPFCSSWLMAFSQEGAYGCGCSDIGFLLSSGLNSIPQTGATFDLYSYLTNGLHCVSEGPWLFGSDQLVYEEPWWVHPSVNDVYPWITFVEERRSDGRTYVKMTVEANNTGAPRQAGFYVQIDMSDMTDCDRYPGITQLG